ncbi:DUF2188 domain-containing protein [Chryseobacterium sp. SN22]|uniref:DUF2188 domain-containing protein n=1 Tax=Chryseobacterium sp. SN22 TaxID=2606431 RepID=UPI0011EDA2D0|nr:DUF2188 domain-containing protein [Chryseobacterium sp. SN22]KAA0125974.1 DUF2188 domain-containing protein [Chryseobacterium sp. SN22]
MKKTVHVVPNGTNWDVKTSGSKKAYRTVDTQEKAINIAKPVAINANIELIIHGKDGKIREKNSYGNDKYPPKG